jgi:cytoskeleton protein RodZ
MNDTTSEEKEAEESPGPIGGERLRAARHENDISVADIAKELHLDVPKVRALERNEFDVLGAPVFAKGHLRKYAELVGVAVDDVMTDYYQMNRSAGAPPVVGLKRKHAPEISLGPWIVGGIAVIVIGAAAYWWFQREPAAPVATIEPATLAPFTSDAEPQPEPADTSLPAAELSATEAEVVTPDEVDATPVVEVESAQVVSAPEPVPVSQGPQVEMELTFSGDCWTEVSDGSGRRLYYDLGQSGRVVNLTGAAPLRVILGDSANVSIRVNGNDYPIPASARSGRLARLNINDR